MMRKIINTVIYNSFKGKEFNQKKQSHHIKGRAAHY